MSKIILEFDEEISTLMQNYPSYFMQNYPSYFKNISQYIDFTKPNEFANNFVSKY